MTALHAAEHADGHRPQSKPRFSPFQFYFDVACWAIAIVAAYLIYYNFSLTLSQVVLVAVLILVASTAQLLYGWVAFLYRRRFGAGSFDEIRALLKTVLATGLTMIVVGLIAGYSINHPVTISVLIIPTAVAMMFGTRFFQRLRQLARAVPDRKAARTLIIGAGEVGTNLVRQMVTTPRAKYLPVGMLDDAPEKSQVQVYHVKVLGKVHELADLIAQTGAKAVIVAVAEPSKPMLREIQATADEYNVQVKVIPPLHELLERGIRSTDLRDISVDDLLGREPVDTNVEDIAGYLTGARVLVTGAGGSIGSELVRQIHKYDPSELIMLDRDEGGLHHTQLSIDGHAMLDSKNIVLADIRDAARLREIFLDCRPEVVLHAAALKHQPLLEMYPQEAWLTNVEGTQNVLDASVACGADVVVNVSTDKAANPVCALGDSKRIAERLTAAYGAEYPGTWVSVRFGNVLGSRGSVIETFRRQIETGGPVTVTHPEVRRYFMTIPEAAQLVLQAAVVGESGETMVLDMGHPMPIIDLARGLMKIAGRDDLEIVYTGLRPGEKMSEELLDDREDPVRADRHPMITEVRVEPLHPLPDCTHNVTPTLRALARNAHSEEPSLL